MILEPNPPERFIVYNITTDGADISIVPPTIGSYTSITVIVESEEHITISTREMTLLTGHISGLHGGQTYFISGFSTLNRLQSSHTARNAISTGTF